jgi:hypothetical protein
MMNNWINNVKDLLPLGATLVTITAWGVLNIAAGENNNALTNQRLDILIEEEKEDDQDFDNLSEKVDEVRYEVTRLANIVDRADNKGLLGQNEPQAFLAKLAPNLAAITPAPTPTPQLSFVYQTTFVAAETEESASPTPTPTPRVEPTPAVCILGICVNT